MNIENEKQEEGTTTLLGAVNTNGNGTSAPSYPQFFVAVFLLAAANSWNMVFTEAFDYYRPKQKGNAVLIGSVAFALLLTVIAIAFARHNEKS